MVFVEARSRAQRIKDIVIGLILIGVGGLWTLGWGIVAALASTFGGEALGWVMVAAALAVGIYVFFLGISFVRGSPSLGGIVRFATIGATRIYRTPASSTPGTTPSPSSTLRYARGHRRPHRGRFGGRSWLSEQKFSPHFNVPNP